MSEQLNLIPDTPPSRFYCVVGVDQIEPNTALHGDNPDLAFVENVEQWGILQPVGLIMSDDEGLYKVAYGRKRIKALRQIGRASVPAFVYSSDEGVGSVLALIENEQRKPNPVTDLEAIDDLLHRGASDDDICLAVGMTKSTLQARKRLLRLSPALREAVKTGSMRASAATEAARLSEEQQQKLVALLGVFGEIKVKDVREARRTKTAKAFDALPARMFNDQQVCAHAVDTSLSQAFDLVIEHLGVKCPPPTLNYLRKQQRGLVAHV